MVKRALCLAALLPGGIDSFQLGDLVH